MTKKRDLAYWKSAVIDMKRAFKQFPNREYQEAVRFAERKIKRIESILFY